MLDRFPKLILGGAQLGSRYGICNYSKYDLDRAKSVLDIAINSGFHGVDTARLYYNSESVISERYKDIRENNFKLYTKIAISGLDDPYNSIKDKKNFILNSILDSELALKGARIEGLSFHRATHALINDGIFSSELRKICDQRQIPYCGVSVQTPEEFISASQNENLNLIQMPFNFLDFRWNAIEQQIKKWKLQRKENMIFVRSIFLQGLLLSRRDEFWRRAHVDEPAQLFSWIEDLKKKFHCKNDISLSLTYVASVPWIDGVIMGFDTSSQITELIANAKNIRSNKCFRTFVDNYRYIVRNSTLDPSSWNVCK